MPTGQADARLNTFGYICRRCSRCCYHKDIQVNPYEVARLARYLGQTTAECRAAWTRNGAGTLLNQTDTGACVFLGDEGCTVHSDRPLVCRLYPLGRHVLADRTEQFSQIEAHPESTGTYTNKGTIADFLEAQGAAPFLAAADEYFYWLLAAQERFGPDLTAARSEWPSDDNDLAFDLIDMDTAIAQHCSKSGIAEPTDIEHRKQLHLTILHQQLATDKGR